MRILQGAVPKTLQDNTWLGAMRIDPQYGSDTGMYLVDVYLESDRECALSHREIWEELRPLFTTQGIDVGDVVDCFLRRHDPSGNWICAGLLRWGAE